MTRDQGKGIRVEDMGFQRYVARVYEQMRVYVAKQRWRVTTMCYYLTS